MATKLAPASAQVTVPTAVLCLLINALAWGVSWWPFRELKGLGLHPLWSTAIVYSFALAGVVAWRPTALMQFLRTPSLYWIALGAGLTNACFNWAVTIGDVVRLILLFYLMPIWAVLLARVVLKEPITTGAMVRIAIALCGAFIVLKPDTGGITLPTSMADWLAIAGGAAFALNNVFLRREAAQPEAARAVAMFFGGAALAAVLGATLAGANIVPWPPAPRADWVVGAVALSVIFLIANLSLQIGATNLPANVTAVVMLTEILFASGSAVLFGAELLQLKTVLGGSLIIGAALLATFWR